MGGAINTVGTCDPLGRACTAKLGLNGTVICYNSAYDGGGAICRAGITNLASNKRAKIFGNKAMFGGGVFVVNSLGVNGALINNNTVQLNGGGIYIKRGGSLTGDNRSVTKNSSDNIYYFDQGSEVGSKIPSSK